MSEEIFINEIKDENSNNNENENKNNFYKIPDKFKKDTINFQDFEDNETTTFSNEKSTNNNQNQNQNQSSYEDVEKSLKDIIKKEAHEKFPIPKDSETKVKNSLYKKRSKYMTDEFIKRKSTFTPSSNSNSNSNSVEHKVENNSVENEYKPLQKTNEEIKNEEIQSQCEVPKEELCDKIRKFQFYSRLAETPFDNLMRMERKDLELMIQKLQPNASNALLEIAQGPVLFFTLFLFKLLETQSEPIKNITTLDINGCYNTAITHKKSLGERLAGLLEEFPELTQYIMGNKVAFFMECGGILIETHTKNTILTEIQVEKFESLSEPNIKTKKKN
jgi:hypothetical protein